MPAAAACCGSCRKRAPRAAPCAAPPLSILPLLAPPCPAAVEVQTDTHCFRADAAVVTVPLGVLKRGAIAFSPPLTDRKAGAIRRVGFGSMNKASRGRAGPACEREQVARGPRAAGLRGRRQRCAAAAAAACEKQPAPAAAPPAPAHCPAPLQVIMLFDRNFWGQADTFGAVADTPRDRGDAFLFYSGAGISGGAVLIALCAGACAPRLPLAPPPAAAAQCAADLASAAVLPTSCPPAALAGGPTVRALPLRPAAMQARRRCRRSSARRQRRPRTSCRCCAASLSPKAWRCPHHSRWVPRPRCLVHVHTRPCPCSLARGWPAKTPPPCAPSSPGHARLRAAAHRRPLAGSQVATTRWGADPFAYGSYSAMSVGCRGGAEYEMLAESLGGKVRPAPPCAAPWQRQPKARLEPGPAVHCAAAGGAGRLPCMRAVLQHALPPLPLHTCRPLPCRRRHRPSLLLWQLFFAGEACSRFYPATMHGAFHSGLSAVRTACPCTGSSLMLLRHACVHACLNLPAWPCAVGNSGADGRPALHACMRARPALCGCMRCAGDLLT